MVMYQNVRYCQVCGGVRSWEIAPGAATAATAAVQEEAPKPTIYPGNFTAEPNTVPFYGARYCGCPRD